MSSTFVPADIIKRMFGCLLNMEIKPSWRGEDRRLPMQPAPGTVPAGDVSDLGRRAFLPGEMHGACGGAQEGVAETRRVVGMPWLCSLLPPPRKTGGKGVGIPKARRDFCCWTFGGVCRRSQEGKRLEENSLSCLLDPSMPLRDMWAFTLPCSTPVQEQGRAALGQPWVVLSSS